jgi:hypothetical protein
MKSFLVTGYPLEDFTKPAILIKTVDAESPRSAFHQVAATYRILQSDDIGVENRPCVRYIAEDSDWNTFRFYIEEQNESEP